MPTPDSRDIIHSLLANEQSEDVVRAALHNADVATRDGDAYRALMQIALSEGDMETVRATASQLVEMGVTTGNLMIAVEGICLLRNVDADATAAIESLLDAMDARGFSDTAISSYPVWTPDLEAAQEAFEQCPPAATALAMFNETTMASSDGPFGWVSLWPHIHRDSRKAIIDALHFEMGRSAQTVLAPPRLQVAWVISGEFHVGEQLFRAIPGAMITGSSDQDKLLAGRHLRLVGLNTKQWEEIREREDVQHALEQKKIRARALQSLIMRAHDAEPVAEEDMRALLQSARMLQLGGGHSGRKQARTALLLEGRLSLPIERDGAISTEELRPGALLHIPANLPLPDADATLLYWRIDQFTAITSLDRYEITYVSSETDANAKSAGNG